MNERFFALSGAFLLAVVLWTLTSGGLDPRAPRAAQAEAGCGPRILKAAADLFDSLGEKAREKALFEFKNEERYNWHFIPRDRKGVTLGELDEGQQSRVRALLSAALSERGARKAGEVMAHEAILAGIEGPQRKFARDPRLYYLTFFSRPSRDGRWGWRLEGHHLSLNFTLDGDRVLSFT